MPDDSRYVSADVAARRLKVSSATVRRRIRAGTLEGMVDRRPQGEVYLALADALPPDMDDAEEIGGNAEKTEETPPVSPDSDVAAVIRAAVEPWERQVAEKDATIREQAETIGHLSSDAEHLTRQVADTEARATTAEAEAAALRGRRSWWVRIWGNPR